MTSWIALRGQLPGDLFDELGLAAFRDRPVDAEPDFIATAAYGGWVIVVVRDVSVGYTSQVDLMERLSYNSELVACYESTYGPESAAAAWENGRLVWKVEHYAEGGTMHDHIDCEGDLPPGFDELLATAQTHQAEHTGVDYLFELPLELAEKVTGFRQGEVVRGARPPITLGMDVKAFSLAQVEYSWSVTGLDSRDQMLPVMQDALQQYHRAQFPGTRLLNRWGVDDDGRWWTAGGTKPVAMAISGFDRWRPEFEATVARRVAEIAPQANLSIEWRFPESVSELG